MLVLLSKFSFDWISSLFFKPLSSLSSLSSLSKRDQSSNQPCGYHIISLKAIKSPFTMPKNAVIARRGKIIWSVVVFLSITTLMNKSLPALLLSLRTLSINLGGGKCKWTPPHYDGDSNKTYFRSLIAGFPGGSKVSIFAKRIR